MAPSTAPLTSPTKTTFRGMTWAHPRGRDPMLALAAAAAGPGPLRVTGSRVTWSWQPLAGFEATSVAELARRFDLVVLDHPHLGDATRAGALTPLGSLVPAEQLARWAGTFVGGSWESYRYEGHQWAVPVDAATQVCAVREDSPLRLGTWRDVLGLGREVRCAVPTAGPHTLLTFLALCAAHDPAFEPDDARLVPRPVGREALALLRALVARTPSEQLGRDPIELLDALQAGEDLQLLPLVYGYATYSRDGTGHRVRFVDAPSVERGGPPGSVLGGAGLAVTSRGSRHAGVAGHVQQAAHRAAQCELIPAAGGQPAASAAWDDRAVNLATAGFYRGTRRTQEAAWRRPRHPGWITFQAEGSRRMFRGLLDGRADTALLDDLDACYRSLREPGSSN